MVFQPDYQRTTAPGADLHGEKGSNQT